jgi:hypothetical protein
MSISFPKIGHVHHCGTCTLSWHHATWGCDSGPERECPTCIEKREGKKPDPQHC